jgi:hypothetical protein
MDTFLEQRVKQLEESISWMQRDINNLIDIIENFKAEQHTHYTTIIYTKQLPICDETDCDEKGFED